MQDEQEQAELGVEPQDVTVVEQGVGRAEGQQDRQPAKHARQGDILRPASQHRREAETEEQAEERPRLRFKEGVLDREAEPVGRPGPGDRITAKRIHIDQQHAKERKAPQGIDRFDTAWCGRWDLGSGRHGG